MGSNPTLTASIKETDMGEAKICEYCREAIRFWQSLAEVFDTDGDFVGYAHYNCAAVQPYTDQAL